MLRRLSGRPTWFVVIAVIAVLAVALPVAAQQSSGIVKGVVKDDKGQPVDGAKVTIEMQGGSNRKFESKSNRRGEFIQIGVPGGQYQLTAEKDKLSSAPTRLEVHANATSESTLVIGIAGAAMTKEGIAKNTELRKTFEEGVASANAGRHDEAIEKFLKSAELNTTCHDCYYNIGFAYFQKKEYDKAETAYKKAIEIKTDYAEAYSGLASIYNAQRKFDLAAEASAKVTQFGGGGAGAAGGGNADALYNQGVILWNSGKIPEAKKQFESAIAANPNHAESHYQLGMALVNEGNLKGAASEFETYLKLAPEGQNAATAKSLVGQLKK